MLTTDQIEIATSGSVSADTPNLQEWLDQISDGIEHFCGWHIAPVRTETLILDGPQSPVLQIPSLMVRDVVSVTENGKPVDPDEYDWSPDGLLARRGRSWTGRYRGVVVELEHGYEQVPGDLIATVAKLVARADAAPAGETSIRIGERSAAYESSRVTQVAPLSGEVAVLDRYRVQVEY